MGQSANVTASLKQMDEGVSTLQSIGSSVVTVGSARAYQDASQNWHELFEIGVSIATYEGIAKLRNRPLASQPANPQVAFDDRLKDLQDGTASNPPQYWFATTYTYQEPPKTLSAAEAGVTRSLHYHDGSTTVLAGFAFLAPGAGAARTERYLFYSNYVQPTSSSEYYELRTFSGSPTDAAAFLSLAESNVPSGETLKDYAVLTYSWVTY